MSVFDTPELYTLLVGPHELGVVHELSFRRESAIVLLGGRSWRVTTVDHKHRIAQVEPAEDLPFGSQRSSSTRSSSTWSVAATSAWILPFPFRVCLAASRNIPKP